MLTISLIDSISSQTTIITIRKSNVKFENENVKPAISRVSSCSSLDSLRSSPVKLADNDYLKHKNVLKESTNTVANNNNNNIIINKQEVDTEEDEIESKLKLLPIGALPLPNYSSQVKQALNMNKSKLFFYFILKKSNKSIQKRKIFRIYPLTLLYSKKIFCHQHK